MNFLLYSLDQEWWDMFVVSEPSSTVVVVKVSSEKQLLRYNKDSGLISTRSRAIAVHRLTI